MDFKNGFARKLRAFKISGMMMKKTLVGLLVFVFLVSQNAFAEKTVTSAPKAGLEKLTFMDCYQKVLQHYPALKKRYEQVAQAKADRNLALSDLFPKIQGVSTMTTSDDPVFVFGSLLREQAFSQNNFAIDSLNSPRHHTNYHFGLQGEMLLFDAFNTISKIRSARRTVKSAELNSDFTEMEAGIVTLEGYLGVLLAREIFNIVTEVKHLIDQDLKQAEDLNQKGMILGADFYAAKVTAAGIERELNRAKTMLKASRMLMNVLMGEDPEAVWDAVGKFPSTIQDKGELQSWIAQAYHERKDLAAMDMMVEAQRIEAFRQKTSILPRFYGFGSLDEDTHNWQRGGQNFTVGIKGTIDLLDPSYPGRIQKAKHQYEALKADRQALRDEIAKQLIGELTRYEMVVADHPVLEQAYQDAQRASELTAKLYSEGRKSIADLLEMRRAYLETAAGLQQVLFALELEYAKLLFLSGQLTETGIHQLNAQLQERS